MSPAELARRDLDELDDMVAAMPDSPERAFWVEGLSLARRMVAYAASVEEVVAASPPFRRARGVQLVKDLPVERRSSV